MTQDQAYHVMLSGRNVFLTGPAGSGKTYLLNRFIQNRRASNISVAVTASTGIAATHLDGRTIHSWAAIGISSQLNKKELDALYYSDDIHQRIAKTEVLVIDEISMLDADRFRLVDRVCRRIRHQPNRAFGGIQLIICGDFFQLPPVQQRGQPPPEFAFLSTSWTEADIAVCYLEKQYRQNDIRFLEVLNDIRHSCVTPTTRQILMERHHQPIIGMPKPPRLYPHNRDVDAINDFELSRLEGDEYIFEMQTQGDPDVVKELKKTCLAPETLRLKMKAQVMFVRNNFDGGYVNGTLGTIVGFDEDTGYPIVQTKDGKSVFVEPASWITEENDEILARITQFPLRLAWAITIHKSQGMSLDCAEIDLSRAFGTGMGYVALSRVRELNGIRLMGLNQTALQVSSLVTQFDQTLRESSKSFSGIPTR